MSTLIALLTDFGHTDPYVGQMKAVLLRDAPQVVLVDLCHEVLPQQINQAAFLLRASHEHFPERTIFVCVVDPGVGSSRALLAAHWNQRIYLAPDNGLLAFLALKGAQFWSLHTECFNASTTFHGRDIFAPLAAKIATGATLNSLGNPLPPEHVQPLRTPTSKITPTLIRTHVLHVDRFGNCLLDVPIATMPNGNLFWMQAGQIVRHVRTYSDLQGHEVGLLAGSQGVMELFINQGSCAQLLCLTPGSPVLLSRS